MAINSNKPKMFCKNDKKSFIRLDYHFCIILFSIIDYLYIILLILINQIIPTSGVYVIRAFHILRNHIGSGGCQPNDYACETNQFVYSIKLLKVGKGIKNYDMIYI